MSLFKTYANGDCLFESLAMICRSISRPVSTQQLRKIVADSVLNTENENTNATLRSWLDIYQSITDDLVLKNEFSQFQGLDHAKWPLSLEERKVIQRNMLNPRLYWGDEYACRILEEHFQWRFLFFSGVDQKPRLCWYHSLSFNPSHYIMLYLQNQHYMPVSFRGEWVWVWEQIPFEIKLFFTHAWKSQVI